MYSRVLVAVVEALICVAATSAGYREMRNSREAPPVERRRIPHDAMTGQ